MASNAPKHAHQTIYNRIYPSSQVESAQHVQADGSHHEDHTRNPLTTLAAAAVTTLPVTGLAEDSWDWEFDPGHQPYPSYLADHERPRIGIAYNYADSDIPGASNRRIDMAGGTRITFFRIQPPADLMPVMSIDLEGALFAQFDNGNENNNIGWEGRLGVWFVQEWSPPGQSSRLAASLNPPGR